MSVILGDCVEVMASMDENSVDAIVTDPLPPYGLEFMGKEWDRLTPKRGNPAMLDKSNFTPRKSEFKQGVGTNLGMPQRNPRCRLCGKLKFNHPRSKCVCEKPDFDTRQSEYAFLMQCWHEQWATAALRVAKPGAYLLAFGGTRTVHRMTVALEDAGWIIRDMLVWAYASGFPKSRALLKPAWEPIVMARKPGPLRDLDIDGCRIGTEDVFIKGGGGTFDDAGNKTPLPSGEVNEWRSGRWPANIVLTDPIFDGDTEGVMGGGDVGSQRVRVSRDEGRADESQYRMKPTEGTVRDFGDTGTYSRFFLIPKASRSDREPVITPDGHDRSKRFTTHPTVKPVELMRHLVRLVTPAGGTVLDPFLGSGTTAIAAEQEGRAWVGIEREAEYVRIAEARLAGTQRGLGIG